MTLIISLQNYYLKKTLQVRSFEKNEKKCNFLDFYEEIKN